MCSGTFCVHLIVMVFISSLVHGSQLPTTKFLIKILKKDFEEILKQLFQNFWKIYWWGWYDIHLYFFQHKKTPEHLTDRLSYSPRRLKRALQDTEINCLSPHKKSANLIISPPYNAKRLTPSSLNDQAKIVSEGLKRETYVGSVIKMASLEECDEKGQIFYKNTNNISTVICSWCTNYYLYSDLCLQWSLFTLWSLFRLYCATHMKRVFLIYFW